MDRLSNDEWWALSLEERTKINEKRQAAKLAGAKTDDGDKKFKSKAKDKKDNNDDDNRSIDLIPSS